MQMRRILPLLATLLVCSAAQAQWSKPIERIYALPYDSVWKATKTTVVDSGYRVVTDKKQAGILETDVKMMVQDDSVLDVMNRYGEVPFIASAEWKWGQTQLKCIVRQVDTVVSLKITAQLRAFDNHTTSKWQYFPSNGIIENAFFDEIERRLGR